MDRQTFKVYVFENKQTIRISFLSSTDSDRSTCWMMRDIIFVSPIMGDEWRKLLLSLSALWWYLVFAPCVQCIAMRWLLFTNKWKKILLQTFPLSLIKRICYSYKWTACGRPLYLNILIKLWSFVSWKFLLNLITEWLNVLL